VGHNHEAAEELKDIFGEVVFDSPKPVRLIKHIIKLATDGEDIVLDSFAGSGTTGQAVLELNQEDDGNRKFILVETEVYADSLTAERLRRVIKGVPTAKNEKVRDGLDGSFSFFELGAPLDLDGILSGASLPTYTDLARYLFYTATGEEFRPEQMDEDAHFIGETAQYRVYLFYKPDRDYLLKTSLTLDLIKALPDDASKTRLVFAPARYVSSNDLDEHKVKFVQLPFEVFR
jgi:adenine-specific DNA-methyltransferase